MPTKKRRPSRAARELRDLQDARCSSIDAGYSGYPLNRLDFGVFESRECPGDLKDSFKQATLWRDSNWFTNTALLLKNSFFNSGRAFLCADPERKKELKDWLKKDNRQLDLDRLADAVANDWFHYDSVIGFYRREGGGGKLKTAPYLLRPEDVDYSDAMGIEKLRVSLGYKAEELRTNDAAKKLSEIEIRRYASGEIELDERKGEFFKVLTRGRRGYGLGQPRMRTIFRALSQNESMEVGESQLAHAARLVLRQHKIGFEVKAAALAAKQAEFLWSLKRKNAIESFFKGRAGFADVVTQFDHSIGYVMPDPKLYDGQKWETLVNRVIWWAGPIGFMLMAKSVSPFLLGMLREEMSEERRKVAAYLEGLINETYQPPGGIKLRFSNRCFNDSRLAWDMVKALMQQGPLSLTTALEQADFNPDEEAERKIEEAKKENDPKLLPKFDPNHGQKPGEGGRAGRTRGQPDGGNIPV